MQLLDDLQGGAQEGCLKCSGTNPNREKAYVRMIRATMIIRKAINYAAAAVSYDRNAYGVSRFRVGVELPTRGADIHI